MPLNVRRVEDPADFARFLTLLIAYEADLPSDLRHEQPPSEEALSASHSGRSAAFLAIVDGEAVGCIAAREFDAETAVIRRLFVQPARRRIGAARALVETALQFLKRNGYARVVLDTDKRRLQTAYDLYRSFGFEECAPYTEVDYQCPTFMELRLAPES
jgi:GNAT superfamily N-acetyltransferase